MLALFCPCSTEIHKRSGYSSIHGTLSLCQTTDSKHSHDRAAELPQEINCRKAKRNHIHQSFCSLLSTLEVVSAFGEQPKLLEWRFVQKKVTKKPITNWRNLSDRVIYSCPVTTINPQIKKNVIIIIIIIIYLS